MNIEDRLRQEHDQWYIDITDIAIEMFGDIVDKVEITDFYDYTKEEAIEGAKALIEKWEINSKDSGITFDGKTCLFLLKMERKLKFGTLNGVELNFQETMNFNFTMKGKLWDIREQLKMLLLT